MNLYHTGLKQWSEMAKPLQALFELNLKTLDHFNSLNKRLYSIKNPQDFLEKQVNLSIENGHNTLDYFEQLFTIIQDILSKLTSVEKFIEHQTRSAIENAEAEISSIPSLEVAQWMLDPTT